MKRYICLDEWLMVVDFLGLRYRLVYQVECHIYPSISGPTKKRLLGGSSHLGYVVNNHD